LVFRSGYYDFSPPPYLALATIGGCISNGNPIVSISRFALAKVSVSPGLTPFGTPPNAAQASLVRSPSGAHRSKAPVDASAPMSRPTY
jgi:hypothetical protein